MSRIKDRNSTIKILALFISVVLWFYVRGEVNPKIIREFRNIKVDIINERLISDAGLILLDDEEVVVSVKVTGRRSDINSLTSRDVSAEVDLANLSKGTHVVPVQVRVPFKIELEDISQRYITYEVDSIETKEKEVSISVLGNPTGGYTIGEGKISPSTTQIKGPSTLLERVSKVIINVNVKNITSNKSTKLPVIPVDSKGKQVEGVEIYPQTVEATIPVLRTKRVPVTANLVGNLRSGYSIDKVEIDPSMVTIKGLDEDIKDIDSIQTGSINKRSITSDMEVEANLVLPRGIVLEEDSNRVNVNIKLEKNTSKQIEVPIEDIEIINIKEGLNAIIQDDIDKIIVNLKSEDKDLDRLTSKDVDLKLDINNLEEGVYNFRLSASILDDIEIESISPSMLKVTLEKKE